MDTEDAALGDRFGWADAPPAASCVGGVVVSGGSVTASSSVNSRRSGAMARPGSVTASAFAAPSKAVTMVVDASGSISIVVPRRAWRLHPGRRTTVVQLRLWIHGPGPVRRGAVVRGENGFSLVAALENPLPLPGSVWRVSRTCPRLRSLSTRSIQCGPLGSPPASYSCSTPEDLERTTIVLNVAETPCGLPRPVGLMRTSKSSRDRFRRRSISSKSLCSFRGLRSQLSSAIGSVAFPQSRVAYAKTFRLGNTYPGKGRGFSSAATSEKPSLFSPHYGTPRGRTRAG